MKIKRIQITNLASLVDADINFEVAPLKDAGLFAITGDTGAGKSTILDALCLALFDKTARLSNENTQRVEFNGDNVRLNDPRHLLRRGKGYAQVMVDFKGIDAGEYRAIWQVKRARNKASGRLQETTIVLQSMPDEQNVCEGKKATKQRIEQLVGLTFEQFSRAVLLAQNEFSTFLRAQGDERAQLLEHLSGTHKYSKVGQLVYERYKERENEVSVFKQSMDAFDLLDEQQLKELNEQEQLLKKQVTEVKHEFEQLNAQLSWYKADAQIRQELASAVTRQGELDAQLQQLSDHYLQAKQIETCWQIEDNLSNYTQTEQKLTQIADSLHALAASTIDQDVVAAQAAVQNSKQEQAAKLEALQKQKPKLQQAHKLDIQRMQLNTTLAQHRTTLDSLSVEHTKLQQHAQQIEKEIAQNEQSQGELEAALQAQPWLLELVKNWFHYAHQWHQLAQSLQDIEQKKKQIQAAQTNAEKLQQEHKNAVAEQTKLAQRQNELVHQHDTLAEQATPERLEQAAKALNTWQNAQAQFEQLSKSKQKHSEIAQALVEEQGRAQTLQQKLDMERSHSASLKQASAHAEQTLQQARLRASEEISHLRTQLVDDQPCMVCGSTSHPYKEDANSQAFNALLADFEQQHEQAKQALDQNLTNCNELNTQLLLSNNAVEGLNSQLNQLAQDIELISEPLAKVLGAARQEWSRAAIDKEIAQSEQVYADAKKEADELVIIRSEQQQVNASIANNNGRVQQLNDQLQLFKQDSAQAQTLIEQQSQLVEQIVSALRSKFIDAPWWQENSQELVNAWSEIETQKQHFSEKESSLQVLKDGVQGLTKQRDQIFTKRDSLAEQQQQQRERIALAEKEISILLTERESLITLELCPEQTLNALEASLEQAQQQTHGAEQALHQLVTQQKEEALKSEQLVKSRSEANEYLNQLDQRFTQFKEHNEIELTRQEITILLTKDKAHVRHTIAQYQKLEIESAKASAQSEQLKQRLDEHHKTAPSAPAEALTEQASESEQALDKCTKELNAVLLTLANHEQNVKKLQDKAKELAQKQEQLAKWRLLNQAIGDAQGKRMRNLVQSQTLAILLGYANKHLEQLSKRYQLTRISNGLDIAIIDRDMADEQRSVNTLSGGETFLVSLAMALGLASLSSNKVKVESLFIDEGFGTLDSETLSVAMDALDSLQGQGRKVGVISHVEQLNERISTQIKVTKRPGGYSQVKCQ